MIYGYVIASLFIICFIFFELKRRYMMAFYLKAFSSFSFLLIFMLGIVNRGHAVSLFDLFIFMGLLLGMIGDLVLALRTLRPEKEDKDIILKGMIAFSLGHIFYLIALRELFPLSLFSYGFGILMMGLIIIMSKVMKLQMGKVQIPSYLYALLIFVMIGSTISNYINFGDQHPGYIIMMIGAILFGLSDLILAPIYFQGMNQKKMIASNLITYYLAQILIASSILFF